MLCCAVLLPAVIFASKQVLNSVLTDYAKCLLSYHHHEVRQLQAEVAFSTALMLHTDSTRRCPSCCRTVMLRCFMCFCRKAIDGKRSMLESLQKRCSAAQSKLEGEYSHLGSLEAKTKELEHLRKVLCLAVIPSSTWC